MLYKAKEGSKSYEFLRDLLEKEEIERDAFYKRVKEAVGFKFDNYKGHTPNSCLVRKYDITSILVSKEFYENEIDKKLWCNDSECEGYISIKPNRRTKKGKEIAKVFNSYKFISGFLDINDKLGVTTNLCGRFSITQVLKKGDAISVYFDNSIRADKENSDLTEITLSEWENIK